jgi:large subunit ribosomal protein L9
MKVILLEELKGRGGEGDVIDVATGYAVNFLLPRKIAMVATSGNLKQLEQRKHNIAKREANRLDTADKLVAALEGQRVRIGAKVGDEGQLFGSVTPTQVADAINARFGTEIDRRRIDLHGIIKTAGEHDATVSVYRDFKANIVIEVVNEAALTAEAEAKAAAEAAEVAAAAEAEVEVEVEAVEVEAEVEAAEVAVEAEAVETEIAEVLEAVEEKLEGIADTLAEIAEAADTDDASAADIADAAVEVLQEVEAVIDAAVIDTVITEAEATDAPE